MKKQLKQTKNINIIFDKKNICSYNISIATLEMLNNLLLLENLVSFDLIKLKRISARGNNAEVKQDRDGNWIVYEVKKIKAVV